MERDLWSLVLILSLGLAALAYSRGDTNRNRRLRMLEHRVDTLYAISTDPQLELGR